MFMYYDIHYIDTVPEFILNKHLLVDADTNGTLPDAFT